MKTLIVESDPMRARSWIAQFGDAAGTAHIAISPAQARLMLLNGCYDRLCLRMGAQAGASFALLSVARATNPDCEVVDLASLRSRMVRGPMVEAAETAEPFTH